ncbi:aminopeptidase [Spirochaetia bacterium]|nr:aminopeptidase [Spirochaetia bacterium]
MELNLGVETRDEYLYLELMKGAMTLVKDVMLVKPGENVVITGDTSSDRRVVDAVSQAVYAIGGIPTVINYATAPNACMEPPAPIGAAVGKADVWIELAYSYIMHSKAFRDSMDFGTRYICLTGMDVEMIVKTVSRVDYDAMIELGEYMKDTLEKADEVIVTAQNGTKLKAYNRGRKVRHSGQKATRKGYPIMLGGQISWCPVEETIEGTLVFDGALWPPLEIGKLKAPVKLEFKEGRVKDISGGADAAVFRAWIDGFGDENMYRLAHYSLGFNPGVRAITGRIVEDERVFGCMEFGIGSQGKAIMGAFWTAASHTDGTVLRPSIILDGKVFEQDGVYMDETARSLCKKLGVSGY